MAKNTNPCKVITSVVRFSYLNANEPKANAEGATPKYSVSLIISKEDVELVEKIEKHIVVPKEAKVVKKIFDLYESGLGDR